MSLLPILDTFTLERPVQGSDAEGNPTAGYTNIGNFGGTYGSASDRDQIIAGQRNQTIDAAVAMNFADVRPGDRMVALRGRDWEVVAVKDVRVHQRVVLRAVGA